MTGSRYRIAMRYARALLQLVLENNMSDRAYTDMQVVSQVFSQSQELKVLLKSPIIREAKKQSVLQALFSEKLHPLTLKYLGVIVRKQRGYLLDGIADAFLQLYKLHTGIESVKVTTAHPMDAKTRQKALQAAQKLTKLRVEFHEATDPEIIGGFILNLGHTQYDASVKTHLFKLREYIRQIPLK